MEKLEETLANEEKLVENVEVQDAIKEKILEKRADLQKVDTFISKKAEAKDTIGKETNQMLKILTEKKSEMDNVKKELALMVRTTSKLKHSTKDAINKIEQTKKTLEKTIVEAGKLFKVC